MSREAMQQALEAIEDSGCKADLMAAADALRAALAEQKCPCGDRPADQCPGEWEPGCDLGSNEKHAKVATADASLGAAIEAIDAALAEQAQPAPPGWRMVPVEPTQAMLDEAWRAMQGNISAGVTWAAMLAAAPEAPPARRAAAADGC